MYDGSKVYEDGQEGKCSKCNPCKICLTPGENGMNCLETFARIYVQAITIFMVAVSVAILAFGIYIISGVGDSLESLELRSPAMASLIFGIMMFTFAFTGFVAATWGNFYLKVIFSIGCGFLTFGILMSGIYITKYSDFLLNVRDLTLTNELEEVILAYELAVFHECCSPDNDPPQLCDDVNSLPCVQQVDFYNEFLSYVGDGTCEAFNNVVADGAPLTGVDPEDCGGQNMVNFISLMSQYLDSYVGLIGSMNVALGVIFLLLTISSVFLFYEEEEGQKKNTKLDDNDSYQSEDSDEQIFGHNGGV